MNRPQSVIISALVTLVNAGCATMYEGSHAPGEEPATIEGSFWGSLRYDRAVIEAIDEKDFGFRPVASASVLPGPHSVRAHCFHGWSHLASAFGHDETLEFIALPGRAYQVKCTFTGGATGSQWTWIEDQATGRVVAGQKPD